MRPKNDVWAIPCCRSLLVLLRQVGVDNLNNDFDPKICFERLNGSFKGCAVAVGARPDGQLVLRQGHRRHRKGRNKRCEAGRVLDFHIVSSRFGLLAQAGVIFLINFNSGVSSCAR